MLSVKKDVQYSCNSHKCVKHSHVFFTNKAHKKAPEPFGRLRRDNYFIELMSRADSVECAVVSALGQLAQAFWPVRVMRPLC
jgi:hypothetical protein